MSATAQKPRPGDDSRSLIRQPRMRPARHAGARVRSARVATVRARLCGECRPDPYFRGGHMNLVSKKRTLLPSTIVVAALALGCGSLAAQVAPSIPSSQLLAQAEPQKPGEERRKEQQPAPPKGPQPQVQPQRPGPQSAQPPQGPRRDQRQDTQRPPAPGVPIGPQNARPGQPQPGAPGAPAVGDQRGPQQFETMRQQRQERTENNGQRTVIEEPDHRMIIRENGRAFVRHDEVERFRLTGQDVRVERRPGEIVTLVRRPGDVEIVTYVDESGRLLRRVRRTRDGREFVLIDNRMRGPAGVEIFVSLPPPRIVIPRDEYIVDMEYAPRERIFAALEAPPIEPIERAYTLDEVRFSPALRDRMRRVDLNTITFEFGSWQVAPDQIPLLANIAEAINQVVGRNPNEVFLIEGHTDAVGNDVDNLSLSDRRAESVAVILTQNFQVPPENLTTQGYGAQQLKVQTPGPSRENRRVTIRRITPLLTGSSQ